MDESWLDLVARLAPGVSREQAADAARLVDARMLPDSAARVGMARTADVLPMHAGVNRRIFPAFHGHTSWPEYRLPRFVIPLPCGKRKTRN